MLVKIKQQSAWKTQIAVTKALFKRELITRIGPYKLGFIWIFIDPLAAVIMLGLILGPLLGRTSGNIPYGFFLLCGIMPMNLLLSTLNSGTGAITANKGLLLYRQVQPLDPFLARFLYQLISISLAFLVFCLIGAWFGIQLSTSNLFNLAYALFVTWLMGAGLGLSIGITTLKIKELEKVVGYLQRPVLYISAVLFPLGAIPPQYQRYLLWNPLVHTVEMSRHCLFENYPLTEGVNLFYPSLCALIFLTLGLINYRNNRHELTYR